MFANRCYEPTSPRYFVPAQVTCLSKTTTKAQRVSLEKLDFERSDSNFLSYSLLDFVKKPRAGEKGCYYIESEQQCEIWTGPTDSDDEEEEFDDED